MRMGLTELELEGERERPWGETARGVRQRM